MKNLFTYLIESFDDLSSENKERYKRALSIFNNNVVDANVGWFEDKAEELSVFNNEAVTDFLKNKRLISYNLYNEFPKLKLSYILQGLAYNENSKNENTLSQINIGDLIDTDSGNIFDIINEYQSNIIPKSDLEKLSKVHGKINTSSRSGIGDFEILCTLFIKDAFIIGDSVYNRGDIQVNDTILEIKSGTGTFGDANQLDVKKYFDNVQIQKNKGILKKYIKDIGDDEIKMNEFRNNLCDAVADQFKITDYRIITQLKEIINDKEIYNNYDYSDNIIGSLQILCYILSKYYNNKSNTFLLFFNDAGNFISINCKESIEYNFIKIINHFSFNSSDLNGNNTYRVNKLINI